MDGMRMILAACLAAGPVLAAGLDVQPYVGKPYATLHARLVSAGYAPFRILQPGTPAYRMAVYNRRDVYSRYPEVQACAGTGLGDCDFVLSRHGDVIVVHTTGETAATLVVADLRRCSPAEAERLYAQPHS